MLVFLFTAYLGVAEVAGVGGGGVTDAGRGVDICQERPRAGQGHVDNQTGLKHLSIRYKILRFYSYSFID